MSTVWIAASRLFNGTGMQVIDPAVLIEGGRITEVGPRAEVPRPSGATEFEFPGLTLIPGLVDNHTHMNLPGDGTAAEEAVAEGDDALLLRSADNARRALLAGVTTARENGAARRTAFALKKAIAQKAILGPRLFISGSPVTVTGGHGWMFGGEADGIDGVRAAVRRLVKDGADFIKVMATGGTTRNTFPYRAAYRPEELASLADEARRWDRQVVVHATSAEGIIAARDAGVDYITHCAFYEPDGTYRFREDIARSLAERGMWFNPTLHVHRAKVRRLEGVAAQRPLNEAEHAELDTLRRRYAERCDNFQRLVEAGLRIVAGSDAAWGLFPMGEFVLEMDAMVQAGLAPGRALIAATSDSASSMRLDKEIGSIERGKMADIVVIAGDPSKDILAVGRVEAVFAAGERVK